MKKIFFVITIIMVLTACSTAKKAGSSRIELKNEKALAEQTMVKKAVETRRFIIKLDRIYPFRGGFVDLVPRENFIIVDGKTAVISVPYLGRQFNFRPIAGITIRGETERFEMSGDSTKGKYEIQMNVIRGGDSFNVFLTIGKNGSCSASLSGIRIDNVRYTGNLVPLNERKPDNPAEGIII